MVAASKGQRPVSSFGSPDTANFLAEQVPVPRQCHKSEPPSKLPSKLVEFPVLTAPVEVWVPDRPFTTFPLPWCSIFRFGRVYGSFNGNIRKKDRFARDRYFDVTGDNLKCVTKSVMSSGKKTDLVKMGGKFDWRAHQQPANLLRGIVDQIYT